MGSLMQLIHLHQVVVRKNQAEEDFESVEDLRNHHRQHFSVESVAYGAQDTYVAYGAQDTKNKVSVSTVISRKHLMAGNYMQARIVGSVLPRADFNKDPNSDKCPKFSDLKADALADGSRPYKSMLAALQRAREQARDLKKRHSRVDEVATGVLRMVNDTRIAGQRSIIISSTEWHYNGSGYGPSGPCQEINGVWSCD